MSIGLKANSDGSGAIQVGGSDAITISTGLNTTFAGTVTATGTVAGTTGTLYPLVSGTAWTYSTNVTSIDFTGIPSWAKRITIMLSGVSTNGTGNILVQVGSGSATTTGYTSTSMYTSAAALQATSSTAGFVLGQISATATISGLIVIATLGSNLWVANGHVKTTTAQTSSTAGDVTLSGTLDRLRLYIDGTQQFDAGSINILYE